MKYADMAKGMAKAVEDWATKPKPAPLPNLAELPAGIWVIFKSTASVIRKGAEYIGSLSTPDGRAWFLEGGVEEHTDMHGKVRGHFRGRAFEAKGPSALQDLFRAATLSGDREAIPQQALDLAEPLPFNDPLPPLLTAEPELEKAEELP